MSVLSHPKPSASREPTIALINVVFLMLIFFMIAGTLAAPMDSALGPVQTDTLDGHAPPDALVVHADGQLGLRGAGSGRDRTCAAMIARSPYIAAGCLLLAGALHAAIVILPAARSDPIAIQGGSGAEISTLGDNFADLAKGAIMPRPETTPERPAQPVGNARKTARAGAVDGKETAQKTTVRPVAESCLANGHCCR